MIETKQLIERKEKIFEIVKEILKQKLESAEIRLMNDPRTSEKNRLHFLVKNPISSLKKIELQNKMESLLNEGKAESDRIQISIVDEKGLVWGTRHSKELQSLMKLKIETAIPFSELISGLSLEEQWQQKEQKTKITATSSEGISGVEEAKSTSKKRSSEWLIESEKKSHEVIKRNKFLEELLTPTNKHALVQMIQTLPPDIFEQIVSSFEEKKSLISEKKSPLSITTFRSGE